MPQLSPARTALPAAAALLVGALLTGSARADAPAPVREAPAPVAKSVYTTDGLLGAFRVGPTVGFGAPDGVRFGAFGKWRGLLAAGGAFSLVPDMQVPGISAQVARVSGEGFARVHPFRGAFFLGAAGGYAQTKGTLSEQTKAYGQMQHVETHAYASAVYIAPQLGFQWMLPFGITVGCDLGVEIPVSPSGPTFDASKYGLVVPIDAKGTLAAATRRVTTTPIPVLHLLEIGVAL